MVLVEKRSDSFAAHFAESFSPPAFDETSGKTVKLKIREKLDIKVEVVWQGRALTCVKTFGTKGCALCSKERVEILKIARGSPQLAINSCNEIYGSCRHRPRFHRYKAENKKPSTDDPTEGERVAGSGLSFDASDDS